MEPDKEFECQSIGAINQIHTKTVSMKSTVSVSGFNTGYECISRNELKQL